MFREFIPETLKINKKRIPIKTIEQEKLKLDIEDIKTNDITFIKSGTATGKTKSVAKLCGDLLNENTKIISIVNLISLAHEQISTFQEESNTTLYNYQDNMTNFDNNNLVICLNSLDKLNYIKNFDMSKYILYIDEVNDLMNSLTHNKSLDKVLNTTYQTLIKLIKNCKKLILSDATITTNCTNLLYSRKIKNKAIIIHNTIKKFKDIEAIEMKSKYDFIDELRKHVKNKDYFLFGCDICEEISSIHDLLKNEFKEQKDDFILITSKTKFKITNANVQFKNKYVFYSPSITTGVSFVFESTKQSQFIYMSNRRLITCDSFYQMSCRTRNIKNLIWYCEDMNDIEFDCEDLTTF